MGVAGLSTASDGLTVKPPLQLQSGWRADPLLNLGPPLRLPSLLASRPFKHKALAGTLLTARTGRSGKAPGGAIRPSESHDHLVGAVVAVDQISVHRRQLAPCCLERAEQPVDRSRARHGAQLPVPHASRRRSHRRPA